MVKSYGHIEFFTTLENFLRPKMAKNGQKLQKIAKNRLLSTKSRYAALAGCRPARSGADGPAREVVDKRELGVL